MAQEGFLAIKAREFWLGKTEKERAHNASERFNLDWLTQAAQKLVSKKSVAPIPVQKGCELVLWWPHRGDWFSLRMRPSHFGFSTVAPE